MLRPEKQTQDCEEAFYPHSHCFAWLHMFHVPDTVQLLFKIWPSGEADWLGRDGRHELVTPDGAQGGHGGIENMSCLAAAAAEARVESSCIVARWPFL